MAEAKTKASSHWWWFDSRGSDDAAATKRSPWLQSTLAELNEKTKAMLRVIEEDADSFAQCAEMYYKKRPELISLVEDFYRAHRSLAEKYDRVKSEAGFHLIKPMLCKYRQEKLMEFSEKCYDSYSENYEPVESSESEVDDPEEDMNEVIDKNMEKDQKFLEEVVIDEVVKLREEIERLKKENKIQREQLVEKDEEKREAIRQLSLAMDAFREENVKLRRCVAKESPVKWSPAEFHMLKGSFLGKLLKRSPKSQTSALVSRFR